MTSNLLKPSWASFDPAELRFILLERIGKPGQYDGRDANPNVFYLPLARDACKVKLTFSVDKRIVQIEPGPQFDPDQWARVVEDVEGTSQPRIGREYSFSSFRVTGSWRGLRSGIQILPPPLDAPRAPVEMAEHPFILEYPVKPSDSWPVANFRRMRDHRRLTLLLNVLLAGRVTMQPRLPRHLWAVVPDGTSPLEARWAQEFYSGKLGASFQDQLSVPAHPAMEEVDAIEYHTSVGHDGAALRLPTDLDESICFFLALSNGHRESFGRAAFWMEMAARQWTISWSASFASLAIAVEALGLRAERPTARFRNFIERYAPGASLERRRNEMYALRSDILHGSGLMEMDKDSQGGWAPPEQNERDLLDELWGLTRIAVRNWLKAPS